MPGNTFGKLFKITTWGESHGRGIGVVIDGCPPNIPLSEEVIQDYLHKRKPGSSTASTTIVFTERFGCIVGPPAFAREMPQYRGAFILGQARNRGRCL